MSNRITIKTVSSVALGVTLLMAGCSKPAQNANTQTQDSVNELKEAEPVVKKTMAPTHKMMGTIVYQEQEGGFYGFRTKGGKPFTLVGLEPQHKKDGLIVEVEGSLMEDIVTTTQFGPVLKLSSIKIIDDTKLTGKEDI